MLTHFKDYAESIRPTLDTSFANHLAHLLKDTRPLQPDRGTTVLMGGKRIRGTLACLVTMSLGGELEDALPGAIAVELIHLASLIHDDFVDQHELRRNAPALWTLEGARRAVLLGDIIFASAIQMMSELGRQNGLVVSRAIAELSRGAYQEPLNTSSFLKELEANGESVAFYEKIIYLKTGILFGAACQLGAIAAKADAKLQKKWRRYGLRIGEAYQIADDMHEVERYLLTRSITESEMTALAPALLSFVKESRRFVLEALRRKSSGVKQRLLTLFRTAAEAMKAETEKRLLSAVSEIEADLPDNEYGHLARETPQDIIRMFNEARPTVASL